MSGATITARGITILLFDWKRFFFPMDDQSKTEKKIFHGQLYRAIKRKPWPGWRDDREVRIE